jgi:SAM-dependent methyltransferase
MAKYSPEPYWSRVAEQIAQRGENFVAGDDDPYYRYKRQRFLSRFLDTIDFKDKVALELGFGPGGNLKHIASKHSPRKLLGADISQNMVEIASRNLQGIAGIELSKINGVELPYPDRSVDISFTVTVLQHNTDERMFRSLVSELCRVTRQTVYVMEDIGRSMSPGGEGDWIGREVEVYRSEFEANGFSLFNFAFLDTRVSRYWRAKVFSTYFRLAGRRHKEGDPISFPFKLAMALPMPLTRVLDNLIPDKGDLARMVFHRSLV